MKKIEIKEYTNKDLEIYSNFKKEMNLEIFSNEYLEYFNKNFKLLKNQKLFLGFIKTKLISVLLIKIKNKTIYIEEIEVLKIFQKKNYGSIFLNFLKNYYINSGIINIELLVETNNYKAIKFYEKNKFIKKSIQNNYLLMEFKFIKISN